MTTPTLTITLSLAFTVDEAHVLQFAAFFEPLRGPATSPQDLDKYVDPDDDDASVAALTALMPKFMTSVTAALASTDEIPGARISGYELPTVSPGVPSLA